MTIHAVTGADISRLAPIRGIDINATAATVEIHDSTAHRRCRLHPLPHTWTGPLIRAAGIHGQLKNRAPDSLAPQRRPKSVFGPHVILDPGKAI
ncbi:hypothetical protein P6B95_03245 [Streptomyces atratus]|uniref:Uncharacterized protein n=1 Tax=Streptomyces atratus TaxID=1893 RepID=A0A2Z5JPJ3_STRAR|nr:hypothetical protein [Streptomyces atratus]AXE82159.1 hypothetical protein C5746_40740 [Streptomyces atratus]WPW26549.1 hypothetical protein P6B95_03245 [Streptomyces atratus]GGT74616.1 hypothetical protein GCM10010207_84970 [Streptomyces atratus]